MGILILLNITLYLTKVLIKTNMKQLTINVTFRGGLGFLRFVVFKGGHQVQNIVFENSSEKTIF